MHGRSHHIRQAGNAFLQRPETDQRIEVVGLIFPAGMGVRGMHRLYVNRAGNNLAGAMHCSRYAAGLPRPHHDTPCASTIVLSLWQCIARPTIAWCTRRRCMAGVTASRHIPAGKQTGDAFLQRHGNHQTYYGRGDWLARRYVCAGNASPLRGSRRQHPM